MCEERYGEGRVCEGVCEGDGAESGGCVGEVALRGEGV